MDEGELEDFVHRLRASVLADLTAAGYDKGEALALADRQITAAFPDDRRPPGHHVCHVVVEGRRVGHAWYGPDLAVDDAGWWLYDLAIVEAHRGSGVGTAVMALVEAEVRALGGTTIGLRVFDHNGAARHLYERSGFRPVSTLMRKILSEPDLGETPSETNAR